MWSKFNFPFFKGGKNTVPSDNNGNNGTTLSETISCTSQWEGKYNWTIDKTVTPSTFQLSRGDSGIANYTITLYNDPLTGGENCIISGTVNITNGGSEDTIGLNCILDLTYPPSDDIIYSTTLDISSMPEITAGDSTSYNFSFIPPYFTPGKTYKVTANTTILNHSGSIGTPTGPSAKCSGKYPREGTIINDIITVSDSMFPFPPYKKFTALEGGGYQSYSYSKTYTCNNEGYNTNTATIIETGDFSTARVTIYCSDETTSLEQLLDFTTTWFGNYNWDITKEVSKSTLDLFEGDSEKVNYTITVSNSPPLGSSEVIIKGTVLIRNTGAAPTKGLFALLELRLHPDENPLKSIIVDLSNDPILDPSDHHSYDFQFTFDNFTPGETYYLTSIVTITNYHGHFGVPFGISTMKSSVFPLKPTPIDSHITVVDSNKENPFEFDALDNGGIQRVGYEVIYSCDDEGINRNVATIRETGQGSFTEVLVNCYHLQVFKTVFTSLTTRYNWTINKACIDPITREELSTVQVSSLTYSKLYYLVTVVPTITHGDILVYGDIIVKNPHPSKVIKVTVTDEIQSLQGNSKATVTPSEFIIGPGQSKTFSYTKALEEAISGYNVATATYTSSSGLLVSCNSESMKVDFNDAKVIEIDPCVNVYDSDYGKLNHTPVCKGSEEFYYTKVIGPYNVCCHCGKEIENTAIYVGTTTRGEVTNIVTICVV